MKKLSILGVGAALVAVPLFGVSYAAAHGGADDPAGHDAGDDHGGRHGGHGSDD